MSDLRGGLIGCGFFARNHLEAWREIDGAHLAALCDLDAAKARAAGQEFGIEAIYDDPAAMLREARLDFVDIVTQPATHRALVELAAAHAVPVICQKPMAPDMEAARAMVAAAETAGIPFMVHENFRWQPAMRALKAEAAKIGAPFFGRISFRSARDIFTDQPYLATDARFIVNDLGVHLLDLARFFMGDVARLHALTQRVNPRIRGEDVATILMEMESGATCVVEMSYYSKGEEELFPQTLVHLEGAEGTATLGPHGRITTAAPAGVTHRSVETPAHAWSTPPVEALQHSVFAAQEHWRRCLAERRRPETDGADNLRTLELVFGAYESAESASPYVPGHHRPR